MLHSVGIEMETSGLSIRSAQRAMEDNGVKALSASQTVHLVLTVRLYCHRLQYVSQAMNTCSAFAAYWKRKARASILHVVYMFTSATHHWQIIRMQRDTLATAYCTKSELAAFFHNMVIH